MSDFCELLEQAKKIKSIKEGPIFTNEIDEIAVLEASAEGLYLGLAAIPSSTNRLTKQQNAIKEGT